jgi:hypothetical protein
VVGSVEVKEDSLIFYLAPSIKESIVSVQVEVCGETLKTACSFLKAGVPFY